MKRSYFTIKADIYRLSDSLLDDSVEENISQLISKHNDKELSKSYSEIAVRDDLEHQTDFKLKMYIGSDDEHKPDWYNFIDSLVPQDSKNMLENLTRRMPSFLLFIYNNRSVYAIVKGGGRYAIHSKIEDQFGISVLERILDSSKDDIRSSEERGVVGSIIAQSRYFARDRKLNDERSTSKFYKSIEAFVPKDLLSETLGIETEKNSLMVGGEDSIKINSKVDIFGLINRVAKIDELLMKPKKCLINKFRKLKPIELNRETKGIKLKHHLENMLLKDCFKNFKLNVENEIYHPAILAFLGSSELFFYNSNLNDEKKLPHDIRITLSMVLNLFHVPVNDYAEFEQAIKYISGGYYLTDDDIPKAVVSLSDWLTGEIVYSDKMYFRFDSGWYIFEPVFIDTLNDNINYLLTRIDQNEILPDWNHSKYNTSEKRESEHTYNLSFKRDPFVVCDRGLLDNIELCDFFKYEKDEIIFYHVKNGLGQSTRVVCNQIMNAARMLQSLRFEQDQKKLAKYWDSVCSHNYRGSALKLDQLLPILDPKLKVKFVLVYGSEGSGERDIEVIQSRSSIAKMCILDCENVLRAEYNFGFGLTKVKIL